MTFVGVETDNLCWTLCTGPIHSASCPTYLHLRTMPLVMMRSTTNAMRVWRQIDAHRASKKVSYQICGLSDEPESGIFPKIRNPIRLVRFRNKSNIPPCNKQLGKVRKLPICQYSHEGAGWVSVKYVTVNPTNVHKSDVSVKVILAILSINTWHLTWPLVAHHPTRAAREA